MEIWIIANIVFSCINIAGVIANVSQSDTNRMTASTLQSITSNLTHTTVNIYGSEDKNVKPSQSE